MISDYSDGEGLFYRQLRALSTARGVPENVIGPYSRRSTKAEILSFLKTDFNHAEKKLALKLAILLCFSFLLSTSYI
jgi:hypothetical protein